MEIKLLRFPELCCKVLRDMLDYIYGKHKKHYMVVVLGLHSFDVSGDVMYRKHSTYRNAIARLVKLSRQNMISTLDYMSYAMLLESDIHCVTIVKRIDRLYNERCK